jgi:pimeloyl-ACP methyl ester carboxylesterase
MTASHTLSESRKFGAPSRRLAALGLSALLLAVGAGFAAADSPFDGPDGPRLTLEQLRAKFVDKESKFMTIGGVEIHYKDEGTGPVILLIHGSYSSLRTWDPVAVKLKAHYRVIRYDVPPLGLSGGISDAVAASKLEPEDIPATLLDRLGVKTATVAGVSAGGTMGYFLAAKRPDLVERLILSNTPSTPVDTTKAKLSKALLEEQRIAGASARNLTVEGHYKRRQFWDALFGFLAGEPDRISSQMKDDMYDMNRRVPEKNFFRLTAVVADQPVTIAKAAKVTCPVLILWGDAETTLPRSLAETLGYQYLKNADVSILHLPDVGHYPPIEIPDRYVQIVEAYIEAVTPVRPKSPPPSER